MSIKKHCDMCDKVFSGYTDLNIVSFFEHSNTGYENDFSPIYADPRLELCDGCFHFLKEIVKQAQIVTIDDIETEA